MAVGLRASTSRTCRRLLEMKVDADKKLKEFEAEARERIDRDSFVDSSDGRGREEIVDATTRKRMLDRAINEFRRALIEEQTEERLHLHAEMRLAKEKLDIVRDFHAGNPISTIMLSTLGTKGRSDYTNDLAVSGPVELEASMRLAVIRGDRHLAAACFARFDALPSNLRKTMEISKKVVSEALLGEDHLNAVEIVGQADYDIAKSSILIKRLSGTRVPSTERIATGLRLKEMTRITGREYDNHGDIIEEKKEGENE